MTVVPLIISSPWISTVLVGMSLFAAWVLPRVVWFLPGWEEALSREADESDDLPTPFGQRWQCETCGTTLPWWSDVPVVGWIALAGHCDQCGRRHSVLVPILSAVGLLLPWLAIWNQGSVERSIIFLPLLYGLIAVAVIDARTRYVPQTITDPLLMLGLLTSTLGGTVAPMDSVWGAVCAYGLFGTVSLGYRVTRRREGLGYGDVMLAAVLGSWLGLGLDLLVALQGALLTATATHGALSLAGRQTEHRIPLATYLAAATLFTLFTPAAQWVRSILVTAANGPW